MTHLIWSRRTQIVDESPAFGNFPHFRVHFVHGIVEKRQATFFERMRQTLASEDTLIVIDIFGKGGPKVGNDAAADTSTRCVDEPVKEKMRHTVGG